MIPRSPDFDLGRDKTRMKDAADADRQHQTVSRILERLYGDDAEQRWELQLLADEVGMGKTFVALGAAFSILQAMGQGRGGSLLEGTQPTVVVIAPSLSLLNKWTREVAEFVRRCMEPHDGDDAKTWFRPTTVDRADDLAALLRGKAEHGQVILTYMDALGRSRKLRNYSLKRRFILGALFAVWGERFPADAQARLLKGAPDDWPRRPDELTAFDEDEMKLLPFAHLEEARAALSKLLSLNGDIAKTMEEVLATCVRLSQPYTVDRSGKFKAVTDELADIYRAACFAGIDQALPLVIVDEAHNWKNGPSKGTYGYQGFEAHLGPLCRRALLLTATPFQLRPQEMLTLLRIGNCLGLDADAAQRVERHSRLERQRNKVIEPVLNASAEQSRTFAREWGRVAPARMPELRAAWMSAELVSVRGELRVLAHKDGAVDRPACERVIDRALVGSAPELRAILREGLRLYCFNEDLSQELGAFVIRHRRGVSHRLFQVGAEYGDPSARLMARNDRSVLHAAAGLDVRGDAELPHYILMRCVSEMKAGQGRSSLGSALTGCYSTLLESAEGRGLAKRLKDGPGAAYFGLLSQLVDASKDPEHPKVKAIVDEVLKAWRAGEKSLVFCFRTHTARRLHAILQQRIGEELSERRERVVGSANALENLRGRFTRRDEDLVLACVDRVFWSLLWAARSASIALPELTREHLTLRDEEIRDLAELAIRFGVDLRGETVDRIFIHRATEHLIAKRIQREGAKGAGKLFHKVLAELADLRWVEHPYGIDLTVGADDDAPEDLKGVDSRGVHTVYQAAFAIDSAEVDALAQALLGRRERAQRSGDVSVLDSYARAPSFWLGPNPWETLDQTDEDRTTRTLATLHTQLLLLTRDNAALAWKERLLVLQALRQAVLRDSIIVRLLPERAEDERRTWGSIVAEGLFQTVPGQEETMADRLAVFVEDMQASSGPITKPGSPRRTLYEGTRLRGEDQVVLVDGSTDADRRERVFAGFNTPLLPEVLICTQVGQEGIDLHRHCRHVIHYDLAWNPAVVEQRTGRVDRIGSKTFRERSLRSNGSGESEPNGNGIADANGSSSTCHLAVGVPYLAGTYDERMYEELRVRAQIFEVLTGGDVSIDDDAEGHDDSSNPEGQESGLRFPVLPAEVVSDLRVRLHVWEANS